MRQYLTRAGLDPWFFCIPYKYAAISQSRLKY